MFISSNKGSTGFTDCLGKGGKQVGVAWRHKEEPQWAITYNAPTGSERQNTHTEQLIRENKEHLKKKIRNRCAALTLKRGRKWNQKIFLKENTNQIPKKYWGNPNPYTWTATITVIVKSILRIQVTAVSLTAFFKYTFLFFTIFLY